MWNLIVTLGYCQSSFYTLDKENAGKIVGSFLSCRKCAKILFVLFSIIIICITLFGSIGDTLDFDKEGFFSYSGNSQYLVIIVFISLEILAMFLIITSCNMKKGMNFLNDNVKIRQPL